MTRLACCCFALWFALSGLAAAQPTGRSGENGPTKSPSITIELNKLEAAPNACRGYFVVDNRLPEALKELRLDIFLFDRTGVILRRVGLPFVDVRPERMKIVLFELADLACNDIGRLLVNDVLVCTGAGGGPIPGCGSMVSTSTRASAKFDY